ncbi:MAG TPA: dTDP-4-dehydrorhamnose reductase, partial [Puia sp.]|nr:dTDP-4-dehydrorhamnose reductase [Puia sp.]
KANSINALGNLNLARVCADLDTRLVCYSTDYVFDGKKKSPYLEQDKPNPLNVYAITKLSGEAFALNYHSKSYVIRISGIYGEAMCRAKGGNFITTMLKLAKEKDEVRVVNDEILTPTPTINIAEATMSLLKLDAYGLYHMTCEGETSWYEFAKIIWETLKLKTPLHPASFRDFPSGINRPFYSVLENQHLNQAGISQMPFWKDALISYLQKYIS